MRWMICVCLCAALCGCNMFVIDNPSGLSGQWQHLTPAEALRIADREAVRRGYRPNDYPDRRVNFDSEVNAWMVHYRPDGDLASNDRFRIYVDDESGAPHFASGQ